MPLELRVQDAINLLNVLQQLLVAKSATNQLEGHRGARHQFRIV